MGKPERIELLQALAVTAELTGTQLSDGAARVMAEDLSAYPVQQVLGALTRCRRELKGRLTVAAVIERLDDGRPGPDEAWAMIPHDQAASVVWTTEMAEAFGIAHGLIAHGDMIAARMAFREAYARIVTAARAERRQVQWCPSLGHDPRGRQSVVDEAVRKGRLTAEHGARLLPSPDRPSNVVLLESKQSPVPEYVREQVKRLQHKLKA